MLIHIREMKLVRARFSVITVVLFWDTKFRHPSPREYLLGNLSVFLDIEQIEISSISCNFGLGSEVRRVK